MAPIRFGVSLKIAARPFSSFSVSLNFGVHFSVLIGEKETLEPGFRAPRENVSLISPGPTYFSFSSFKMRSGRKLRPQWPLQIALERRKSALVKLRGQRVVGRFHDPDDYHQLLAINEVPSSSSIRAWAQPFFTGQLPIDATAGGRGMMMKT